MSAAESDPELPDAPAPLNRDHLRILSIALLTLLALATPFVVLSAAASWRDNNNDLISWADNELPTKKQFQRFVDFFGRPELVVLSWPGCEVATPELGRLKNAITEVGVEWFEDVATSASVLEELRETPGNPSDARIREQLSGILFGNDGLACLVLELGPAAREQRPAAIERLRQLADTIGIESDELRIGGMGAELAALDFESVAAPARLTPITGIVMLILCSAFLRSIVTGAFMTAMGSFTGILSAAIIHWCGVQSNAVLATLPTLGGLLSISLGLHFIGYYRGAQKEHADTRPALRQAYRWAWKPTLISALTTALGLGSLSLSRTVTIRQFGLFGAVITGCAAVVALTALPAFLYLRDRNRRGTVTGLDHSAWERFADRVRRYSRNIIVTITALIAFAGYGLRNLKTGVHVDSLFVPQHEIMRDEIWIEEKIGPLSSLETVVTFPRSEEGTDEVSFRELTQQLMAIQRLEAGIRATDRFGILVSAATGITDPEEVRGLQRIAMTARIQKWLEDHYAELLASGFFATGDDGNHWRISVRIPTVTQERTTDLRNELDAHLEQLLPESLRGREASCFVTGLPLLFEQIEQQFIEDLLITYIGGLIFISLTVLIVLRSFKDAATAMIPNVLPAVGVLGGISLLGIKLDVGSVMTASIALGVAVDDTLHFVLWFQQERRAGKSSAFAMKSAVLHCGAAILQTSVICGMGLAVLGIAPFLPTARFGVLIALMLGVALIGDLLFLPAMLAVREQTDSQNVEDLSNVDINEQGV